VAREARALGISLEARFAHLTVHGILHLQGHDHSGARDARNMEHLEARILAKLGYPDPYRSSKINAH
jgi:probable rRNA maturation factor